MYIQGLAFQEIKTGIFLHILIRQADVVSVVIPSFRPLSLKRQQNYEQIIRHAAMKDDRRKDSSFETFSAACQETAI